MEAIADVYAVGNASAGSHRLSTAGISRMDGLFLQHHCFFITPCSSTKTTWSEQALSESGSNEPHVCLCSPSVKDTRPHSMGDRGIKFFYVGFMMGLGFRMGLVLGWGQLYFGGWEKQIFSKLKKKKNPLPQSPRPAFCWCLLSFWLTKDRAGRSGIWTELCIPIT